MRTDPLRWRNTTRSLRLFLGAALRAAEAEPHAGDPDGRTVCALFAFGATEAAAQLGQLTPLARRRCELAFLRRTQEPGLFRARRARGDLHRRARQPRGRAAIEEGRVALVEWLRGCDPAPRLRDLLERTRAEAAPVRPRAETAPARTRAPARVRHPVEARLATRSPARAPSPRSSS